MYGSRSRIDASSAGFFSSRRDSPGDREQAVVRHLPRRADSPEERVGHRAVLHERAVALGNLPCRTSQEPFPCYRAWRGRTAMAAAISRSSPLSGNACSAWPTPYQPGQHHSRLRPAEYPRNRTQVFDPV